MARVLLAEDDAAMLEMVRRALTGDGHSVVIAHDGQEALDALSTAGAMPPPTDGARDRLWLIVVCAFAIVLVGSFTALAVGVFVPASGKVTPELILTMFTSVVGFLAGLFVPSPIANQTRADG